MFVIHSNSDSHCYSYPDSNRNTNSDTASTDAYANCNNDTNSYGDSNADIDPYSDTGYSL
jgi:hypothetical protein